MSAASPFAAIEEAIAHFREGRLIIIVDDEDRENEGDLAIAAEKVTPAAINFMAKNGRGLICLALDEERCRQLELPLMVEANTSSFGTAFTVSIEARGKTTTGISAADRAATILTAIDPATRPEDLRGQVMVVPIQGLVDWARKNSMWPVTFGLACCAIEYMAIQNSRFDLSRFGTQPAQTSRSA